MTSFGLYACYFLIIAGVWIVCQALSNLTNPYPWLQIILAVVVVTLAITVVAVRKKLGKPVFM